MKKYVLLLLFCNFTLLSFAQESSQINYTHRIGLNFGGVTGLGPSYRYWPGKFGVQLSFLPIKISDDWEDPLRVLDFYESILPVTESKTLISAGLSGLLTVKEKPKYLLITYLGNHFIINDNNQIYNLGGGFGIVFKYKVSFSLLLGYAGYDITGDLITFPTAEVGIHVGLSKK